MAEIAAVTGADGFIGSHLVEQLVRSGFIVRALAMYNSVGTWGWLDRLPSEVMANVEVVMGDVRDQRCMREFVVGASTVYHLAALIAIPYSYRAPQSYVETNVIGTLNVLEAVLAERTPRLVHTSTSETYGTARTVPINESHPLQAQSPYAASKVGADKLVESYVLSFDLDAVTLRPFNTFGPRQSARAVISTIISQLASGEHVIKLGSLRPTRDFNFVIDTANAFLAVGTAPSADVRGRVLNAGSGREISIADLVRTIGCVMGHEVEVKLDEERMRPEGSEVMRLLCDSSALRASTDWSPQYTLEQGLELTAEWFTQPENLRLYRTSAYTI
jgi:NDP-hexose 4,6-dehydratase